MPTDRTKAIGWSSPKGIKTRWIPDVFQSFRAVAKVVWWTGIAMVISAAKQKTFIDLEIDLNSTLWIENIHPHHFGCPSYQDGCSTLEYQQLGSACCSATSRPESWEEDCYNTNSAYSAFSHGLQIRDHYPPLFISGKPTTNQRNKVLSSWSIVPVPASPSFHINLLSVTSIHLLTNKNFPIGVWRHELKQRITVVMLNNDIAQLRQWL